MKIIVDAMGGDNAPQAPVMGALKASELYGVDVTLVGRGEDILKVLEENGIKELPAGVEIAHASEVVEMCDNPATAFREKKDSSLTVGLTMLKNGQGDAFVSAGSTGALLAAATLLVKRIKGIRRAAMAPVVPVGNGGAVLIDCGANAECPPEYLLQFAYLGSYYAGKVLGKENPRVGLLNIGAEPNKGDALRLETYERLRAAGERGEFNFVGNVEAKEAMLGECDVIVADGFSGNILLKAVEGAGKFSGRKLKEVFGANLRTKIGYLLVKKEFAGFKKLLDPSEVGGVALLGISKPVVKAHGSSDALAICNAVRQAMEVAKSGIIEDITANVDKMKVSREEAE